MTAPIWKRADGTYEIEHSGRYHATNDPNLSAITVEMVEAYLASLSDEERAKVLIPEPTPPEPSAEQKAAAARASIISQLQALEQKKLRPLGAIINGTSTDADKAKLADLETQIGALRAQLATIG